MSETEKPKLSLKTLQAEIEQLREEVAALTTRRNDLIVTTDAIHGVLRLLMQDKTVPALTAHRAKWKAVRESLERIINQEDTDDSDAEGQD